MALFWVLLTFLLPQLDTASACIKGTIVTSADLQGASIIAKPSEGKSIQNVTVSSTGTFQFELCDLANKAHAIDVMCRGVMMDTLYLGTVADTSRNVRLTYPIELHKNIAGHWICPKCHRADKTVEIVYGDGIAINTNPKARKAAAGCIDNGTRGYCRRDQIKF